MLINAGYTPDFKGTRSAKKTIKMYRIKSMTSPTQVTISKELLMKFGKRLDEIAKKEFDKRATIKEKDIRREMERG